MFDISHWGISLVLIGGALVACDNPAPEPTRASSTKASPAEASSTKASPAEAPLTPAEKDALKDEFAKEAEGKITLDNADKEAARLEAEINGDL